jgi:GT2 family glycosyltransferase
MRKARTPKNSQQANPSKKVGTSASADKQTAISEEAGKELPFEINSVQIADSGAIFLMGWADDRSSGLRYVRLQGQAWSKTIDTQHIGRYGRSDVEGGSLTSQQRLFGFWAFTVYDRALIDGNSCSVELVLANGTSRVSEVPIDFIAAEALRARFAKFWGALSDADHLPPGELTYLEQALKQSISTAVMPKHNVEIVTISEEGGVFINGWIDDTGDKLRAVRVSGNDGHVTLDGGALARTYRSDVQAGLCVQSPHEFGFWGFAADAIIQRRGNVATVDLLMGSNAWQRLEVPIRSVDQTELRHVVLSYLASAQHLGNPQLEAVADLENYIGGQIVDLNLRMSRRIVSQPYVERFGRRAKKHKGSIVVCLYGKPEYLFLQNSLFSNRPGIENYEFVYICNSPELVEPLLRNAHIASSAYDIDQTLVILPGNAGFGAANNAAVNFAQTDRLLVVNPDVFPRDENWAVKHIDIVEQLPREQTNIFGVPLYYDDGSLMHGGMYFEADRRVSMEQSAFKSTMFLRVEHYGKGTPPLTAKFIKSRPVPAVTGAFMSLNRNWFENIGGFSEDYVFGSYEDADLCLKSLQKGISPWIHDVKLWHLEGKGSDRLLVHEGASIVNRWLFNKRWAGKVIPNLLGPLPNLSLLKIEQAGESISFDHSAESDGGLVNGTDLKARKQPKSAGKTSAHNDGESICSGSRGIELMFDAE